MIQTTIYEAIAGGAKPETEDVIRFKILNKLSHEEREVIWVANARGGVILADWMMGGELRFRGKSGQGLGVVKDWIITKAELAKLKKRTA